MLWLIFSVLTALAAASALWPLLKPLRPTGQRDLGVAIYKAQIAGIERYEALQLVGEDEARSAKVEAARRLLAGEAAAPPPPADSTKRARLAAVAVLIFIPAVSLTLYATMGHPELPDAPLASRGRMEPGQIELAAAIAKVEAHLAQHPEDGRGYEVLAPVYLRLGRANDAVNAARSALRLLGPTAARQELYAESLVVAANGAVTPEAKQLFEAAAAQDPSAIKPRFFLGLSADQQGDKDRARDIWGKLLAEAPAGAPWAQALRGRMAALGGAPSESPPSAAESGGQAPGAPPIAAIRAMVDRLAARLSQNGQDLEGWLRLVRSYAVLQEPGKARSALSDARRNLASDPAAMARLDALARELGLEG